MEIRPLLHRIIKLALTVTPCEIIRASRLRVPDAPNIIATTLLLFRRYPKGLVCGNLVRSAWKELRREGRADRARLAVGIHIPRYVPLNAVGLDGRRKSLRLFKVVEHTLPAPAVVIQVASPVVIVALAPSCKELPVYSRAPSRDLWLRLTRWKI